MKMKILLSLTFILLLSSCSRKFLYTEVHPENIAFVSEDNIEYCESSESDFIVRTAFIGNAIEYSIFHFEIENMTNRPVELTHIDFTFEDAYGVKNSGADKYKMIKYLKQEKKRVKKRKKENTIGNILLGGLTVAAIATGGGVANTVNAISYSAETAAYVLEDRRAFNIIEGSLEEEINYIEKSVVHKEVLEAYEVISKDVIFSDVYTDLDFQLRLRVDGQNFSFPYNTIVKEGRQ